MALSPFNRTVYGIFYFHLDTKEHLCYSKNKSKNKCSEDSSMTNEDQLKDLLKNMTDNEKNDLYMLLSSISSLKSQRRCSQEPISVLPLSR